MKKKKMYIRTNNLSTFSQFKTISTNNVLKYSDIYKT